MKAILDKAAIRIAYATTNPKEKRVILEHVQIGNSEIVGANGYILLHRAIPTDPKKGQVILVNAKAILEAAKILRTDRLVIKTRDSKTATITTEDKREDVLSISITIPLLDAEFPKFDGILPKTNRKAYVALSRTLLTTMLKATDGECEGFRIKVRGPTDCLEIYNGETKILAMPYHLPEES